MGRLGIQNPEKTSYREFENSKYITENLVEHLLEQNLNYYPTQDEIAARIKTCEEAKETEYRRTLDSFLTNPVISDSQKKLLRLASEKGSGSWLTAIPIQALGYALNKEDFK